jgi:protein TonB
MAAAPNAGLDSEGARAGQASWNSELAARIRRSATYSSGGNRESATVQVSVTIDRNGRLLSHRIVGSSGSPDLDRAAMTVIERAQPFPPFPPGMTQAQVSRIIPLRPTPR